MGELSWNWSGLAYDGLKPQVGSVAPLMTAYIGHNNTYVCIDLIHL